MAKPSLNTDLSRRTIVTAGTVAAVAAAALPASAAPPITHPAASVAALPIASRADVPLLQRLALAEAAWIDLCEAGARCKTLCRMTGACAGRESADGGARQTAFGSRGGTSRYDAAETHYTRKSAAFETACAEAFETPARSLRGLHARFRLALRLTREYDILDHPPYDWLESALAELANLAKLTSLTGVQRAGETPSRKNPRESSKVYRGVWEARA